MAITLVKTLQGKEYTLYFSSSILFVSGGMLGLQLNGYESQGHFTDDFQPIIIKREVTSNSTVVNTFNSLYPSNIAACVQAFESYLVNNITYYNGGVVSS